MTGEYCRKSSGGPFDRRLCALADGHAGSCDYSRCARCGGQGYIAEPFGPRQSCNHRPQIVDKSAI